MVKPHSETVSAVPATGDLPAYTLLRSVRATHVRLRVTPHEGLVVVVPSRLVGFDVDALLRERREWIAEATAEFAERRAQLTAPPETLLPAEVAFPATGERWPVVIRPSRAATASARVESGLLVVRGPEGDAAALLRALRRWLQRAATERLLPMLADEAARVGVHPTRAGVRGQRARWGGCSHAGSVTLNRCLLFLEPELVRSVILHELAHLAHPNHSAEFWSAVDELDPDAAAHHEAIRQARDTIPPWAEPSGPAATST